MITDRTSEYICRLISELRKLPAETGLVEFKEGNSNPEDVGEYLAALSNTAAVEMLGLFDGYLIGIRPSQFTSAGHSISYCL